MTVELAPASDRAAVEACIALRVAVFVDEQGIPREEEVDAYDGPREESIHALVREPDGMLAGTGRLVPDDPVTARIGRMAVAHSARGRGVGRAILDALVAEARRRGYQEAVLNAQVSAVAFYERAGFRTRGSQYDDCGIPHITMTMTL